MSGLKRNWGRLPGRRSSPPPCKAPRLSPEPGPRRSPEAPWDILEDLERLSGRSPRQLLAFFERHELQLARALGSPAVAPGKVYTVLRAVRQVLEGPTEAQEAQPVLELVLQPAFLLQSLLGFIANLETFRCKDGQISQEVMGDAVAALHHLLEASPGQAHSLLCYPVDLLCSTIQRLQSRGFQFTWISQKRLWDTKSLLDKAFSHCGESGPVSPAGREDFHLIPVFPTPEDIFLEPSRKLKPNILSGRYKSDAEYLDTHFRLLREDLIKPLRDGISSQFTLRSLFSGSQKPAGELRLYQNVELVNVGTSPAGVTYLAKFRGTRSPAAFSSKRLLTGSLVCLISNDCDHVLFGTVARSNVRELLRGTVWLDIQQGHGRLLKHLHRTSFTMVESPAFFEAYRHVLEGLQELDDACVPFRRYIVKCDRVISRPSYLEGDMAAFDVRALHPPRAKVAAVAALAGEDNPEVEVPLVDLAAVSPFCAHLWTGEMFPHLDESQISAIRMALSTEFALIQGPPGTGKTFIGLKLLEILLDNPALWNKDHAPCLVVCYTNHALDQFLEGILRFHPSGVVRIGGRSKSEAVAACSLKNLRKQQLHGLLPTRDKQQFGRMLQELRRQKESIAYCTEVLELLPKGLLTEQELKAEIQDDNLWIPEGGMLKWLNIYPPREEVQPPRRQSPSHHMRHGKGAAGSSSGLRGHSPEFFQYHKDERFLDDDNDYEVEGEISPPSATPKSKFAYIIPAEESTQQKWMLAHLKDGDIMSNKEVAQIHDTMKLRQQDRWRLYRRWVAAYENELKAALVQKLETYEKDAAQLEALSFQGDLKILRRSQVVGMTTTGAAKYRKLLQTLRPRIVMVEEAAEILEAHVLTSLTTSCDHLILIGDHQQLRPKPADYSLEKKYGLGISLFERMVNNRLPRVQLLYQHRMRPEISQLLVPCFYKELRDHSEVLAYESIKGVERSVFFVQHREEESRSTEAESYSNRHEAAFLVSLASYLLKQGYRQSQITVLTPYHGQVMRIRALLQQEGLEKVAAHAVDDFQGEENDIVLLSLVRSNRERRIGFLKDKNRLCVALSRAKKGFYCIGNLEHLSASHSLWKEILGLLSAKSLLGEELTLMCQNHPETKTTVKDSIDFNRLPDGGCALKCETRLECGHPCTRRCHPCDREHRLNVCKFPCSKDLCELNHRCPKNCTEPCGPCEVPVEKVIPKCGHSQTVPCHVPATSWICEEPCQKLLGCGHPCKLQCGKDCRAVLCKETVQVTLPCSHATQTECFKQKMALPCHEKCLQSLTCGHGCKGSCSECVQGRIHAACRRKCSRVLLCSHVCQGSCSENCPPCERACPNRCCHSRCSKTCGEACFPCKQPCAWRCRHHQCTRMCSEVCNRPRCDEPCPKTLKCKHPCVGLCGEPCPPKCRACHQEELAEIFFGSEDEPDSRFVVLEDCGHVFEVGGLDQWMGGEASQAQARHVQQKVCPKCSTPIQSNPRYNDVIKATQQRIEEIKRKIRGSKEELQAGQAALLGRLMTTPCASRYFEQAALMKRIETTGSLQSLRDWENTVNFLVCIQKLKNQAEKCTAERKGRLTEAAEVVESWVCRRKRGDTFTAQQLGECRNEIKRISYLANIFERLSNYEQNQVPSSAATLAVVDKVVSLLSEKAPFTEAHEELLQPMLETIDRLLPASGTRLSQAERVSIMEAMRFGSGRWYTCPKGHLYTVGQCGRPMEESRCPECRSAIGGQNHNANPGNRIADNPVLDPGDGAEEDRRRLSDITESAGPSDHLAYTAAISPVPGSPSFANDSCREAGFSPRSPTYPPPSSCQVEPRGTWEECSPTASPGTCWGQEAPAPSPSPSPEDAKAAAMEDAPLLEPVTLHLEEGSSSEEEGESQPVVPQPEPGGEREDSADGVSPPQEPGTPGNSLPGIPQLPKAELDVINPVQRRRLSGDVD
ncbi:NFX1-type zinc finger-containing protein 1-like [Elgaria multicarinata webbii]|uniref:NFX1-type zinc finger-containing protein 1-like n=1 Tax=Elgaria multicarinata webbii TaxID=159646 RepID=UPI002FCCD639